MTRTARTGLASLLALALILPLLGLSSPAVGQSAPHLEFTTVTFEDGTLSGVEGRGEVERLTVTDEANRTEGGRYALKVEGRSQGWHGPSLRVEPYLEPGQEYLVSVWVRLIEPAQARLQLSTQIGQGSAASYVNLTSLVVTPDDGWVLLEAPYRYTSLGDGYVTLYVESPDSPTASFYIDDIHLEPTGSGPITFDRNLTPLKEVYGDLFLIGNVVSPADLGTIKFDFLTHHYHVATAENAMKPEALQEVKGEFTFDTADRMVDAVLAAGLKMHGHTLAWHQQTPVWMHTDPETGRPLPRDEALANLRAHIRTVMEHFGDRVISWDVVNEAIVDNPPDPDDWRGALRPSGWYQAIGPDWVEQAFRAAREVLDEHPEWAIALYYNDYNLDNQAKARAVARMVEELNRTYAAETGGRRLIDGIGMQGHYSITTNPANVRLSLERFAALGVEVSITELDVTAGDAFQLTEEEALAQAVLYAQLFQIFKEHAPTIARVTFWGLDDGSSWRADRNPLLFDRALQPKLAFHAVRDPELFLAAYEPPPKPEARHGTATFGTPVIDGEVDPIWHQTPALPLDRYQTAWHGASGTARVLWDHEHLYVLVQVTDEQLDRSASSPWEQDSIEVFIDENNAKTTSYEADDGQYRVNYVNEPTFNPAGIGAGFASSARVEGTAYTVEVQIPFRTIRPEEGTTIGFDVQINDARDGVRQSIATWNDLTGNGWQDPSVFGHLTLVTEAQ